MATAGTQAAKTKTLTKREVIDYLGKSKRTVETYIEKGVLAVEYINGKNGREAQFAREDVERFKREMAEPMKRAVVPASGHNSHNSETSIVRTSSAVDPFAGLAAKLAGLASFAAKYSEPKPWLTLAEAAEYSGLPASWLLIQARAGKARAINVGSGSKEFWRFHRGDLAK